MFTSDRSGHQTLWVSDDHGQNAHRLSNEAFGAGRWSPDGMSIAFECRQDGNQICLSDFEGKGLRKITRGGANHTSPAWSHDGKHLYYTSDVSGTKEIYRIDFQSGSIEGLTNGGADKAAESEDGRRLYFRHPSSLTGIDTISLSAGRQNADEQKLDGTNLGPIATNTIFYWQVNAGSVLFAVSERPGTMAMLTSYRPSDKSFQRLFPLPSYDGADLPGFSLSPREQAVYYSQSAYKVELKILEPGGARHTPD